MNPATAYHQLKNILAKTKLECAAKLAQLWDALKEPTLDQPKPEILLADWLDLCYQEYKKPNLLPNTQILRRLLAGKAVLRRKSGLKGCTRGGGPPHRLRRTGQPVRPVCSGQAVSRRTGGSAGPGSILGLVLCDGGTGKQVRPVLPGALQ